MTKVAKEAPVSEKNETRLRWEFSGTFDEDDTMDTLPATASSSPGDKKVLYFA